MAGTDSCCNIGCCEPLTNFVNENWDEFSKGVITLRDGVKRNVVYMGIGKFFDAAKKVVGSIEGWDKMAGVIIPLAALAMGAENAGETAATLDAIAESFQSFKDLKSSMGWVGIGDDHFKKDWSDSKKHIIHNILSGIERVCLITSSILGVVEFGGKLGLFAKFSLTIGGLSVKSICLFTASGLKLVGNGITLWMNAEQKQALDLKIANLLGTVSEEDKARLRADLIEKLTALKNENEETKGEYNFEELSYDDLQKEILLTKLFQLRAKRIKLESTGQLEEGEISQLEGLDYIGLKKAVAEEKARLKAESTKAKMDELAATIVYTDSTDPEERERNFKLIEKVASLLVETEAYKKDAVAFGAMGNDLFVEYKQRAQFDVRANNLNQKNTKTYMDIAACVFKLVVLGSGLGKAYFGVEYIIGKLSITEATLKAVLSSCSLISGSYGFVQFIYNEYHKEDQKEVRAAGYYAARVAQAA